MAGGDIKTLSLLAVYDNPLASCSLSHAQSRTTRVGFISYPGETDTWLDKEHFAQLYLSGCPYNQRVSVEELNNSVIFMEEDEMDAAVEEKKEEYGRLYVY